METYEISFNDWGIGYVVARSMSEAEAAFLKFWKEKWPHERELKPRVRKIQVFDGYVIPSLPYAAEPGHPGSV